MDSSRRSDPPAEATPENAAGDDRERALVEHGLAHATLQIGALEGVELRFSWVNDALARSVGLTPEEVQGRKISEVMPLLFRAAGELLERAQRTGERLTVPELEIRGPDLVPRYYHVALAPLPGSRSRPAGVVFMGMDISERKRSEEERAELLAREQRARADAELANRLKDEFLARVSHELATPLAAMKMWIHLLRIGNTAHAKEALDAIDQCAKQQSKLIEDLLDVARAISGKLRITLEPLDPVPVIESAIVAMRPQAEQKNLTLEVSLERGLGRVLGDKARLHQITTNLLANAIKFTRPNGNVWVRVVREASDLVLEVADDGQGIKLELLPHLFAPFHQGDGSITREHGGLGLGLSIVLQLVQLHGGTVTANSAGPGRGATFRVRLPIAEDQLEMEATLSDANRTATPPPISGVRVLVVDDDDATREGLALVLESFGASVRTAASAKDALSEVKRELPEVLLCDIAMPVDDGYTLIRWVRALDSDAAKVPAAAITAHGRIEDRIRALSAGFQHHVAKPVEPGELALVVASLAGRI